MDVVRGRVVFACWIWMDDTLVPWITYMCQKASAKKAQREGMVRR